MKRAARLRAASPFLQGGGEGLEDVRDPWGDVEDDGHVIGGGLHG